MRSKGYFFCGVGGSGMMPLALMMLGKGARVSGSDRGYDQGKTPEKFKDLQARGITLFPQDGSGLTPDVGMLVVSSAIEDSIPDVRRAMELKIPVQKRAEILADLFNGFKTGISIAGTSGKSTVTGMIATILEQAGLDPVMMNGGVVRNFGSAFRPGQGDVIVTETDESDGTIALFNPAIAVLNNIALDHKSMAELESMFAAFVKHAGKAAILNFDDARIRGLAKSTGAEVFSYAIDDKTASLTAQDITFLPDGVKFTVKNIPVRLNVPGRHNVSNALAALGVAMALGLDLKESAAGLAEFKGIQRRFEVVGTKNGITVIDDFAHNPDKIAATLRTLKEFPGRLMVIFQPHGFGPLKLMGREIADAIAEFLGKDDMLLMPEAYYAGGTADKSVTSKDVIAMLTAKNVRARWFQTRDEITPFVKLEAKNGDRVVVMGARDDTLSEFARGILDSL